MTVSATNETLSAASGRRSGNELDVTARMMMMMMMMMIVVVAVFIEAASW